MNRRERRARKSGKLITDEAYAMTCDATFLVFAEFLKLHPEDPPRFALVDPKIAFAASLLDIGHKLARNETAHTLIDLWKIMTEELKLRDGPTYLMMRACVEKLGTPFDLVALEDLGLKVLGMMSPGGDA